MKSQATKDYEQPDKNSSAKIFQEIKNNKKYLPLGRLSLLFYSLEIIIVEVTSTLGTALMLCETNSQLLQAICR